MASQAERHYGAWETSIATRAWPMWHRGTSKLPSSLAKSTIMFSSGQTIEKNKDKNCNHPFFSPRVYSVYTKASWDRPVTGTKLTLNVYYQWWIEFVERSTICYRRDLDQGFFLDGYNSRVSESSATSIFVPSSPYWYQRLELCRVKRSWPLSGWGFINIEWTRNENSTRNRLKAIENL